MTDDKQKDPWHMSRWLTFTTIAALIGNTVIVSSFLFEMKADIRSNHEAIITDKENVAEVKSDVDEIQRDIQARNLTLVRVSVQIENQTAAIAALTAVVGKIDERLDNVQQKEVEK